MVNLNDSNSLTVDIELKNVQEEDEKRQINFVRSEGKVKLYNFLRNHLWLLPTLAGLFIFLLFGIVYTTALLNGHVNAILPFISDAGTFAPQASLFTQLLNTVAFFVVATAYVRYKQLKYYLQEVMLPKNGNQLLIKKLNSSNFTSLLAILLGAFGATLAANFRSSEWILIHTPGAILVFCGLYYYAWTSVKICNKLAKVDIESKPVSMTFWISLGTFSFVVCMISMTVSGLQCTNCDQLLDASARAMWNEGQPGYWAHVSSTATEWVVFLTYSPVLFCIAKRMRQFKDWSLVEF